MTTELIAIEKTSVQEVFTNIDKLNQILDEISKKARSIVPDTSTAKGRKEIASIAYQVARTKTYLDGLGKELVAEMKKLPGLVDSSRKQMRDYLDVLSDEVRKPLTDWEEEQARIEREAKEKAEAEKLAKQIESDWEIAIFMDREFEREKADKKAKAEQEQREREEAIRLAAEAAAAAAAEKAIREAREAQEKAERLRAEAEQRAIREREESAAREEAARKQAVEQERIRRERAELQQKQEEQRRQSDVAHRGNVNREALNDMLNCGAGISEDAAKQIIRAIAKGEVRHITINY